MNVYAQQIVTITGTVSDNGGPLPGVSVRVKGTSTGDATNADGKYTVTVMGTDAVLVFSYVGYIPTERTVGNQREINVILVEDAQQIEEIVVVGYGTQKKANLTGAVSTVSMQKMETRAVAQTSLALTGLVPGVVVTQRSGRPGADGGNISIRGRTTLGNNDVLILVDGMESNLNFIDSKSIESISVLKDAASAAIYGNRAANGVILVTTKRAEDGKAYVSYSGFVSKGVPTNVPKYVGAVDFMKYINLAKQNVGLSPDYAEDYIRDYEAGVNRGDPNFPDTDWFEATNTNNGVMNNHFVTINIGTKDLKSIVQGGYLHQNGLTENTNFQRFSLRSNTDYAVSDKIKLRSDLAYVNSTEVQPQSLDAGYNWVGRIPSNQAAFLADGRYGPGWQGVNPVAAYKDGGLNTYNVPRIMANFVATYKPLKFLEFKGQYAFDSWMTYRSANAKRIQLFNNDGTPNPQASPSKTTLTETSYRYMRNMFNGSVTADHSFNESHNLKFMLGYQQELYTFKWYTGYREEYAFVDYPVLNAGGLENQQSSGSAGELALQAVFARLNYNFKERYLFEATVRYDGSSRFAKDYRWGLFPSVSVGWRISEEDFWEDLKPMVNNLKLRASWGQLGNQNASGLYPSQAVVNITGANYIFDKNITNGAALTAMANSIISWETTTQTNVGLDISLFNKIEVNAEYFYRRTDDILLDLNIPLIIGQSAPSQNAGSLENKGWELGVTFNDKIGDLNIGANFNLSDVKNKVLDMKGILQTGTTVNREGYPAGSLLGYEYIGFITPEDFDATGAYKGPTQIGNVAPGDLKYKDQDSDGVINSSDQVIIGSPIPRYTFGLGLFLEYKGVDLNLLLQGVGKADGYVWGHSIGAFHEGGSMPEIYKDNYWTTENRNAMFPRLAFNQTNNTQISSFWRKDASYMRMKNVQLGYTIPERMVSKVGISNLRLYISTDNLFTITKFWKQFDVEAPILTGYGQFYPLMRTTTFGIDLKF